MFNVDKMIQDLEEFNKIHDNEINPTEGEKALEELKQAVAQLKEERKAKANKNKEAMKDAKERSNNINIDKYVAMINDKKKEFKENYF